MGKGEVWINGQSIGRYWASFLTSQGSPYQTWYALYSSLLSCTMCQGHSLNLKTTCLLFLKSKMGGLLEFPWTSYQPFETFMLYFSV
ncbi:hypothetical protein Gogos_008674 [Gossypium gossypioides]|uniref:Beta-galactosidase galactose-binding domain-containing protein n=1 Tax=Gossypium gossypioides TaxID=34282 RepID=A0A7J9CCC6_GOSGO|nr:hypothetical protein [Gossypium gossypioides]